MTALPEPRLQPLVRGKVAALGEAGAAWQAGLPLFELTTTTASLEEAFMHLTSDAVEYRTNEVEMAGAR